MSFNICRIFRSVLSTLTIRTQKIGIAREPDNGKYAPLCASQGKKEKRREKRTQQQQQENEGTRLWYICACIVCTTGSSIPKPDTILVWTYMHKYIFFCSIKPCHCRCCPWYRFYLVEELQERIRCVTVRDVSAKCRRTSQNDLTRRVCFSGTRLFFFFFSTIFFFHWLHWHSVWSVNFNWQLFVEIIIFKQRPGAMSLETVFYN